MHNVSAPIPSPTASFMRCYSDDTDDVSLVMAAWFWDELSSEDEEKLLRGKPDGSFLVRKSTSAPGDYTICVRHGGATKPIRIYNRQGRFGFSFYEPNPPFSSVVDLIEFYRRNSLKQYNLNLDVTLLFPVERNDLSMMNMSQITVQRLTNELRSLCAEYLRKSRDYDVSYDECDRLKSELERCRKGLNALHETLAMFDEQMEEFEKFQCSAEVHEMYRLRLNGDKLIQKRAEIAARGAVFQRDILYYERALTDAQRRKEIVEPDLVPLKRRCFELQRQLASRGVEFDIDSAYDDETTLGVAGGGRTTAFERFNDEIAPKSTTSDKIAKCVTSNSSTAVAYADILTTSAKNVKETPNAGVSEPFSKARQQPAGSMTAENSMDYVWPNSGITTTIFDDSDNWLVKPSMSKQYAMSLLEPSVAKNGTFLVRPSETRQGCYALSVVCRGSVFHCLIERLGGSVSKSTQALVSESESRQSTPEVFGFVGAELFFASLVDLVKYYSANSLKIHNPELDTTLTQPALLERRNT